jgi:hypothetical protein
MVVKRLRRSDGSMLDFDDNYFLELVDSPWGLLYKRLTISFFVDTLILKILPRAVVITV